MPAILRNSLPKLFPSITNIRPYAQNEANAGSGGHGPPCHMVGGAPVCEHYTMPSVSVVHRPSGPPDCVSTVSIISATGSAVLSRISGRFGLIAAAGNSW